MNDKTNRIDTILLSKGIVNKAQLDAVKAEHIKTGETIESILIKNGLINQDQLVAIKGELIGVEYVDPASIEINPEVLKLIPIATAKKYTMIPFFKDDYSVSIAMVDPLDLQLVSFLERSTNLKVKTYISTSESISNAIEKEYSKNVGDEVSVALAQATSDSVSKLEESLNETNSVNIDEIIRVSPVAQIVSILLEYAVKMGASDIHIEPQENTTRIRYRIDGVLQEKFTIPKSVHNALIARIKILAKMPIDEHRKPLDGRFMVIFGENRTDLRISSLPAMFGEKLVIRLLKPQREVLSLIDLGLWGAALNRFEKALKITTGIMLVTGPTGSGKTVTLATALAKLNSIKVNIISLEDPVEINVPGVNQVQVNPKVGLTFASGLRSILRQDPNIIMVGEIRDGETAQLAIQAALTGHLVLATLHTNSAAGAIPRLIDMGIERFLLSSTFNAALAQRLARRICSNCKESYTPAKEVEEDIKKRVKPELISMALKQNPFSDQATSVSTSANSTNVTQSSSTSKLTLYRGKGCSKCNNKGFKGRIGLYEVMTTSEAMQKLILQGASTGEIHRQALAENMITLVEDGYLKALWGLTTIEEVMAVAG